MKVAIGIEIGGTKIQAGAGRKGNIISALARMEPDLSQGAEGIRKILPDLIEQSLVKGGFSIQDVAGIGVGFGGPVDSKNGVTLISHQVDGWENYPLKKMLEEKYSVPVSIQNDASIAGFAEAKLGAGAGCRRIFYITIGSGIGGGLITNGEIDEGQGLGAAEIGHTWVPCPDTGEPEKLELVCSGWSIARRAIEAIEDGERSLMTKLCGSPELITAKIVYAAAEQKDLLACTILDDTCKTLSLAICNVFALLHPEKVIIGGGVSLMGPLFWDNLKEKVAEFIFEPFADSYEIVPAALGEEVVVAGAMLLGEKIGNI